MKCITCEKDFGSNKTNYDRHMGSKEHLGRLYNKPSVTVSVAEQKEIGVVGAPPTPDAGISSVEPPLSLMVVPTTNTDLAAPSVSSTINWKKWAMIAGAIILALYALDAMDRNRRTPTATPDVAPGKGLAGKLTSIVPPALIGIVGLLVLSKLMRGEFAGWNKIFRDFTK